MLFKYLTFREGVSETNPGAGGALRPKKVKVTVLSRDGMPVQTLEVKVKPREQFCD